MALATMIKKLNTVKKKYDALMKEAEKSAAKEIGEMFKGVLPKGYAISWTQYTPYFNDGEPCTFSVKDAYVISKNEDGDWVEQEEEGSVSFYSIKDYGTPPSEKSYERMNWSTNKEEIVKYTDPGVPELPGLTKEHLKKAKELWETIPKELFLAAFGDHTQNRILWNGKTESDDHEHE